MYELYYGTEKHKSDIFNVNEYEKETSNRRLICFNKISVQRYNLLGKISHTVMSTIIIITVL